MAAMIVLSGRQASAAGTLTAPGFSPASGTANSVFRFRVTYADQGDNPQWPSRLDLHIAGTTIYFPVGDSHFHKDGNFENGYELFIYVTGGLDMRNVTAQGIPGYGDAGMSGGFLPDDRVHWLPYLRAKGDGSANDELKYWWYMEWTDPDTGVVTGKVVPDPPVAAPTIYDTFESTFPLVNAYNGVSMGIDYLKAFPDGWPFYHWVDPLDVTNRTLPSSEDPTQFPDEGSTTSTYTFRVTYDNRIGFDRPPLPWMLNVSDTWANDTWESGVMLYIRNLDWANLSDTLYVWDGKMAVTEQQYWKHFYGHHMYIEKDELGNYHDNTVPISYVLKIGPTSSGLIKSSGDHWISTWAATCNTNRYYEALPPGRYEYYFACSDDDYSAWAIDNMKKTVWPQLEETPPLPTAPAPHDFLFDYYDGINYKRALSFDSPPSATTWTASTHYYLGDFVVPTVTNGHKYVCYVEGTSGTSEPTWPLLWGWGITDHTARFYDAGAVRPGSYVDKQTYMPGAWASGYPYDSWVGESTEPSVTRDLDGVTVNYQAFTFPVVNPGLFEISGLAGGDRFLGTLSPYKKAVIPSIPGQDYADMRLWAESAGGTDHDVFTFKINYWQSAGIAPSYVRLYIKNGWNADDGQPWGYRVMEPSPGQGVTGNEYQNDVYKTGVTYESRLSLPSLIEIQPGQYMQLAKGPHCYYFEAADQQWTDVRYGRTATVKAHVCRYPRRADTTEYDGGVFYETVLPNKSPNPNLGDQNNPVENDFINGPWINTKPELVNNSWSVTPRSGPAGTNFRFRITYKDADNQRPFPGTETVPGLDVIIQTDDAGNTYTRSMEKAKPNVDDPSVPADNYTRPYTDGVVYECNISSAEGLRLQLGDRQYRFAFTDDWGSPVETDDTVAGETVYAPANGTSWAGTFRITENTAPKLTSGSVVWADGTSNEATIWNYNVWYTDANNQPPYYILVYIGRQDNPPSGPIVWDGGHAIEQVNVQEAVYNNPVQFYYSTRLPGDSTTPKKYYHCFVASDGADEAYYNASTSASSGMVWKPQISLPGAETLTSTANPQIFNFKNHPVVSDVPANADLLVQTNYASPLIYHGSTLLTEYDPVLNPGGQYTIDNVAGSVTFLTFTPTLPISSQYWFGSEPGASGPLAVGGNNEPQLYDGQVAPAKGQSSTNFVYTVSYKDLDGQKPNFVNAIIDGKTHPMTNATESDTYREGVTYTHSMQLTSGNHSFYFEASDGSALAVFEADPSTIAIDPIQSPYVNDRPTFTSPMINPAGSVTTTQAITYSITYRDNDNEAPNTGYPVVYVDNPDGIDWNGTALAVTDNTIKSSNLSENWTTDQFAGMPVQITLAGTSQRIVYKILSNTTDTLTLVTSDLASMVPAGSEFTIGKLLMSKLDETDQVYSDIVGMIYQAKVPSLGMGTHEAHFKAVTTEQIMPGQTEDYTLRYPSTGDMAGPVVTQDAPPGNVAPTLTSGGSTPQTGTAGTPFRFAVTYTDENGDPPSSNGQVVGYINLVIEETPGVWKTYPMSTSDPAPLYSLGVEFSYTMSLSAVGAHQFYFEASDGWYIVRLPSSTNFTAYISRPPILTGGLVTPTTGNSGRVYEYKVKYVDPDGNPPGSIKLYIDSNAPVEISVPMPGADYTNGVVYSYPTSKNALTEGPHEFYFEATDGYGYGWYDQDVRGMEEAQAADPNAPDPVKNSTSSLPPTPIVKISGPDVHANTAGWPKLLNGSVTPTSGYDLDAYTYQVTYKDDPDNDEPEFVEVYIDGAGLTSAHKMEKVLPSDDYASGVQYEFVTNELDAGTHSYFFKASDWLTEVTTATVNGVPVVEERASANITLNAMTNSVAGQEVTAAGYIKGYGNVPLSVDLTLAVTKPGGSATNVTVHSGADGYYQYAWTPKVTGVWSVMASWSGKDSQYKESNSVVRSFTVTGPSTTVSGLDMISIPLTGISIFPDGVFGANPPFALAKWLPAKKDYKLYSLLPGIRTDYDFPAIATGQGYWIKTLESKVIAPAGTLVDDSQDYDIPLGAGWNQIGCPFTREVNWSALRVKYTSGGVTNNVSLATAAASGWIKDYGWMYDKGTGNYNLVRASSSDTLIPWKGYWLKANVNCTLVIPGFRGVSGDLTASGMETEIQSIPMSAAKWEVKITARNGQLKDQYNYFGASRLGDERIESPGCFEGFVDLYFTDSKNGMYASDLKGNLSVGDSWQCNVNTDREGEVVLEWSGLEDVPTNVKLVLVDLAENKSVVIIPGGSYRFRADAGGVSRSFRIDYLSK